MQHELDHDIRHLLGEVSGVGSMSRQLFDPLVITGGIGAHQVPVVFCR
jgi:hypothetical protein